MTDSDWAVKHSTSGFVFMLNTAAISRGSKKQTSTALSSCEAELMAGLEAAKEAVYFRGYHEELGYTNPPEARWWEEKEKGETRAGVHTGSRHRRDVRVSTWSAIGNPLSGALGSWLADRLHLQLDPNLTRVGYVSV